MAQMKLFVCPVCENLGLWDWERLTELYEEFGDPPPTFTMDGPCGTIIPVEDAIDVSDDWTFGDPIPNENNTEPEPEPEPAPEPGDGDEPVG